MGNPKINTTSRIVCLGGGVGTSNLVRGLKKYFANLTVITSMADDGGSSGKLRKAYNILPPGDIISCIAALIPEDNHELASLLIHRFPGRSRENKSLDGQKLGNLIMLAEIQRSGDFYQAIEAVKKMFGVPKEAHIYPATDERTHLSAQTLDGRRVYSETTLDLALYAQPRGLKKIYIRPKNPLVNQKMVDSLKKADIIISGPGDLFTNQLPVLVIPQIKEALLASTAQKFFIINVANKPFETKNFFVSDYVKAIEAHLPTFPFDTVFANNNQVNKMPQDYKYSYVPIDKIAKESATYTLIADDFRNNNFPLYHDPTKLAKSILRRI